MGCVYVATNMINGKKYVGVTSRTLEKRRAYHEGLWNKNCRALYRALLKYGADAFTWHSLYESDDAEMLINLETYFIVWLNTIAPNGYNLTYGAFPNGGVLALSKEAREKISAAKRGNKAWLGKKHTKEARKKMSAIKRGNKNWLGKKHTDKTRAKIGTGNTGKKRSAEHRAKIGAANATRIISDETRAKLSESHKRYWAEKKKKNPKGD